MQNLVYALVIDHADNDAHWRVDCKKIISLLPKLPNTDIDMKLAKYVMDAKDRENDKHILHTVRAVNDEVLVPKN